MVKVASGVQEAQKRGNKKMGKYEVGQKVVVQRDSTHYFTDGEIVEIVGIRGDGALQCVDKGGIYQILKEHHIKEVIKEDTVSTIKTFKKGDKVRLKEDIVRPEYGWGSVRAGDIGEISGINKRYILIDFERQEDWKAEPDELEKVNWLEGLDELEVGDYVTVTVQGVFPDPVTCEVAEDVKPLFPFICLWYKDKIYAVPKDTVMDFSKNKCERDVIYKYLLLKQYECDGMPSLVKDYITLGLGVVGVDEKNFWLRKRGEEFWVYLPTAFDQNTRVKIHPSWVKESLI